MLFGNLNCALVLQRKLPSLSPHVCPLCVNNMESIQHLLFDCVFASKCWFRLIQAFNFCWVFYHVFKNNVSQILAGPNLKKKTAECLWANAVKAFLAEIWFERNQRVFHDKSSTWMERYDSARLNASSWCSLSKFFQDYSSQEIVLNWSAFIASPPWSSSLSCLPDQAFCSNQFLLNQGLLFLLCIRLATLLYHLFWTCIVAFNLLLFCCIAFI